MKGSHSESLIDRLERFSVKKESGCTEWIGHIEKTGYGSLRFKNKRIKAHRASWIAHKGEIPEGLLVCHHCDNRKCINPDHLFIGTQYDNIQDMKRKNRDKFVGEDNGRAVLTEVGVIDILKHKESGVLTRADLARKYNVSWDTIASIWKGTKWKHI